MLLTAKQFNENNEDVVTFSWGFVKETFMMLLSAAATVLTLLIKYFCIYDFRDLNEHTTEYMYTLSNCNRKTITTFIFRGHSHFRFFFLTLFNHLIPLELFFQSTKLSSSLYSLCCSFSIEQTSIYKHLPALNKVCYKIYCWLIAKLL